MNKLLFKIFGTMFKDYYTEIYKYFDTDAVKE